MNHRVNKLFFHALIWFALAVLAYNTAGPYHFASCWPIVPLYLPPLNIVLFAIAISSVAVLQASISRPQMRADPLFWAACHGMVLTLGLVTCKLSAYAAIGQVDCL